LFLINPLIPMTSHQTARSIVGRECGVIARLSGGNEGGFFFNASAGALVLGYFGRLFSESARQKPRFGRK
jgi:hypothetical protein